MLAFVSKCADMRCLRLGTAFYPVNLIGDATTNGGDASRVGFFSSLVPQEKMQLLFSRSFISPTRDASPPLELAFCA